MSIVNQLDVMYYDRSLWIKYFVVVLTYHLIAKE